MEHNFLIKKFNTVVIDGAREELVYFIKDMIDDITHKEFGEAKCRPLDGDNSTMMLIETTTYPNTYKSIQYVLDTALPGRCLFNYQV